MPHGYATTIPGGHLQTILPWLVRPHQAPYHRERLELDDGDFLDLDWLPPANPVKAKGLIILSHGLEGSSRSSYLAGCALRLAAAGYDVLAWHCRSCSGEMNRLPRFYHLGDTGDLERVLSHAEALGHERMWLAGFSAGGAITLKWAGEQGPKATGRVQGVAAISAPLSLAGSAAVLDHGFAHIYNARFCKSLQAKALAKLAAMPGQMPYTAAQVQAAHTLRMFDEAVTAPLHGFASADDYYTRSSARQFVPQIAVPALVLSAYNDPFLSKDCYMQPEELPSNVQTIYTNQGGHCGWPSGLTQLHSGPYYQDDVLLNWLKII